MHMHLFKKPNHGKKQSGKDTCKNGLELTNLCVNFSSLKAKNICEDLRKLFFAYFMEKMK
jgi:hypothetical protein